MLWKSKISTEAPETPKETSNKRPLSSVHSNVVDLFEPTIYHFLKYSVILLDKYSTYTLVYFEKRRSIVGDSIINTMRVGKDINQENIFSFFTSMI